MLFTQSFEYLIENGIQNWMTDVLSKLNIENVKVDYHPKKKNEPIIWHENSRLLVIYEPDPFRAVIYFLEWAASELPKQWKYVWDNLQHVEKLHGKKAADNLLKNYIKNMEKSNSNYRWELFKI